MKNDRLNLKTEKLPLTVIFEHLLLVWTVFILTFIVLPSIDKIKAKLFEYLNKSYFDQCSVESFASIVKVLFLKLFWVYVWIWFLKTTCKIKTDFIMDEIPKTNQNQIESNVCWHICKRNILEKTKNLCK